MENELRCKYCRSDTVIKYGVEDGTQFYYCKVCKRKFSNPNSIPKMHYTTSDIWKAINMYYEGMSLNEIRRAFIIQCERYISKVSAYNWVNRFTQLAVIKSEQYQPKVGDTWIADETYLRVDKRSPKDERFKNPDSKWWKTKRIVIWDIIDADTRFLLASHVTTTSSAADAKALMDKAVKRAGIYPKVVVTDKLKPYIEEIESAYDLNTGHRQDKSFRVVNDELLIERFHGILKDRHRVIIALKNEDNLQKFTDGWLVHYNFFRPYMSLNDKTPAEQAGITFPFRNWRDVVEQPYQITSRIPIKEDKKPFELSHSVSMKH